MYDDPAVIELGRKLLTTRGVQWVYGNGGDPYSLLLRDEGADPHSLYEQVRERGPLHRSRAGAWVTADYVLASQVLADPRLDTRRPDGASVRGHVLEVADAGLGRSRAEYADLAGTIPARPPAEEVVRELLDTLGSTFDLVTDFARPLARRAVAETLEIPTARRESFGQLCAGLDIALDSALCPPRLADAVALVASASRTQELGMGLPEVLLMSVGAPTAANLIANALRGNTSVAETRRADPPVRIHSRIARSDLDLAGHSIESGSQVVVLVGAAHRDPAAKASVDAPVGSPNAVVADWVDAVAEAGLRALAERMPQLCWSGPPVRRPRSPVTRALLHAPVAVTPTRAEPGEIPCAS